MDAHIQPGQIVVELTERNLRTLLAKLDNNPANSLCTIAKTFYAEGETRPTFLYVTAVPNEAHYADREPGQMHQDTETAMKSYERSKHDRN